MKNITPTLEPTPLTTAQKLAQALANTIKVPTYVVAQGGNYLIQDDADLDCYGGRAAIVATYAPIADPPPPEPNPLGDEEGDEAPEFAVTRQSIAIDQIMQRCHNCGAEHRTWQCPEVGGLVSGVAVYDTADMVGLWCANRTILVRKLRKLTAPQLLCQAMDFAAWLNEQTHANLPALSVLHIWEEEIDGQRVLEAA